MRRLRAALAVLLVALAVPVALLVSRALESARLEERVRHETVAERVFDEMERTLSEYLAQEEARTPDAYRFYLDEDPREIGRSERSPLSRSAPEPFVVAHFQIDPEGRLHSPLEPDDEARAIKLGDWPPSDAEHQNTQTALEALRAQIGPLFERSTNEAAPRPEPDAPESMPTRRLAEAKASSSQKTTPPRETPPSDGDDIAQASAYEVLSSLNVGAKLRESRQTQVTETKKRVAVSKTQSADSLSASALDPRAEPEARDRATPSLGFSSGNSLVSPSDAPVTEDARERTELIAPPEAGTARAQTFEREVLDAANPYAPVLPAASAPATLDRSRREAPAKPITEEETVRIVLEPMSGHALGERYLMLYRTVLVGREGYRQGVLLDRAALGRWLTASVIGNGPLAEFVRADFERDLSPADGQQSFLHRFGEPFSGLSAALHVGPLRGSNSTSTILWLAGGLAVVALLGVFAVHRMVAVVVEFAERRNNFVAAVSHELKTPLTAIRMHGEMLRDDLVPSEDRRSDYYRTITDESERLSRLIDNVLEFSRLERGHRPIETVIGSPGPVVAEIVERLRPHAEREGFRLAVQIEDGLPPVRFDRDALAQMIFNLVDNAIKYAAQSEKKEILVRCAPRTGGDGVAVSVRDFGPGVARDQLAKIFEPFHRVEAELTRSTKGSGIGLSLVKQLGDAMGARVRGECPGDGGFRVWIDLRSATA